MPRSFPEGVCSRLSEHLEFLYGPTRARGVLERLIVRLKGFVRGEGVRPRPSLSERTSILITYGDQVSEPGAPPLHTLGDVLEETVSGLITDVHILPFFPYSSDDGFSVIDYEAVDPKLGDWSDIHRLTGRFGLMADLVINHVSAQSPWFQGFLRGEPGFSDFFITVEEGTDLSNVVRPRALPLLTPVKTNRGEKLVWTTFSSDQIDLNYANPEVLLRMIDVLLFYVRQGVTLIRLDAVAFLWKRIGSACVHCEETHRIVKLMRGVLDAVAPDVLLITETNVPHGENIGYFGSGTDEAQLVYQFPLPPLVVDAFQRGDATSLSRWAATLAPPPGNATFFNFLASHDGIGLRPLKGLLEPAHVEAMVERTVAHGGCVSFWRDSDGIQSAYELNISFFDALSDPRGCEPIDLQVRKFLTAQAIMVSLAGVPGIYFHSLFGSRSWLRGVEERGENRAINREKLTKKRLLDELHDVDSLRAKVFGGYRKLLETRNSCAAFSPHAPQRVLAISPHVFAVLRGGADQPSILCLHNVSGEGVLVRLDRDIAERFNSPLVDLLRGEGSPESESEVGFVPLCPYGTVWLTEASA